MRSQYNATRVLARLLCFVLLALWCLLAAACSQNQKSPLDQDRLDYSHLTNATRQEADRLAQHRADSERLEHTSPRPMPILEPMAPEYNPLDEALVSVTMHDQPLHDVLYVVARNAGVNLVIEPDISLDNRVTISFESAPSSVVIDNLLRAYDLSYEVSDNVLYVKRYVEKSFDLGFLNLRSEVYIENGGDIYGSSSAESDDTDLRGNFQIATTIGKGIEELSLYDFIQRNIRSALGIQDLEFSAEGGEFTLDPIGGNVYVRTTPRRMHAVEKIFTELRNKMSKQVVIDARILEVQLKDEFYLGVQWNYVLNKLIGGVQTNFTLGNLILDANNSVVTILPENKTQTPGALIGDYVESTAEETLHYTIQALQEFGGVKAISNPHIRARHGQAALMTSGTTESYIREVSVEIDDETDDRTYTVETAKAFSGIMLGVYPFIKDDGGVDLQVFPIKSSVDLSKEQSIGSEDLTITLPKVDVQNVLTSLHVRDGDTIILGGLIDKGSAKDDGGVPGLVSVPVLGRLFRQESRVEGVKELVIIMNVSLR